MFFGQKKIEPEKIVVEKIVEKPVIDPEKAVELEANYKRTMEALSEENNYLAMKVKELKEARMVFHRTPGDLTVDELKLMRSQLSMILAQLNKTLNYGE